MSVFGRASVILSAVGFWGMAKLSHRRKLGLFVALLALSCIEKSASIVNLVAIERDWVSFDLLCLARELVLMLLHRSL